jgi:hypothetical protein
MKKIYLEVCCYDDHDKIISYLTEKILEKEVESFNENRGLMLIKASVPDDVLPLDFLNEMLEKVKFQESVSCRDKLL